MTYQQRFASQGKLLQELRGHVYEFCRDQYGSRFIQLKLETASSAEVGHLFF